MGRKLWTVKEELYIKKYYNTKSISEIAKVLKRSYNAVQRKAQSLNLCVPKPTEHREWTEKEELYLERYYEKRGVDFIAKKFNRTPQSIKRKAQNMGLNAYICEELYVKQIAYAFSCDSSVINRWIDKFALPCREFYRGQLRYRSVDIKTFWKWADTHRDIIPWEKYEKYNLPPEPSWLDSVLKDCSTRNNRNKITSYEKSYVIHQREIGHSFKEIADKLGRTENAIKHIWRSRSIKKEQ